MSLRPFRILAFLVPIVALFGNAMPSRSAPASGHQLVTIVRTAMAQAPLNYASSRGPSHGDDYEMKYAVAGALARVCPHCVISDEFADAKDSERWVAQFSWDVPVAWSDAQIVKYARGLLSPLLPGYTLSAGKNDYGLWNEWYKKANGTFVYIETERTKTHADFMVRVGHFLPKAVHYTKWGQPLNATQRAEFAKEIHNFVQIGVQNAGDNFASLRGKAFGTDGMLFDANIAFGEYLTGCDISGITGGSGVTGKWVYSCDTPALTGAKSDMLEVIRTAVYDALPSGFSADTDPQYLFLSDYRWDRSSDSLSAMISSFDNNDGTFTYHVEIYHFTS
jgi:hypothetical protein